MSTRTGDGFRVVATRTGSGWEVAVYRGGGTWNRLLPRHWHGFMPSQLSAWSTLDPAIPRLRVLPVRGFPQHLVVDLSEVQAAPGPDPDRPYLARYTGGTIRLAWRTNVIRPPARTPGTSGREAGSAVIRRKGGPRAPATPR